MKTKLRQAAAALKISAVGICRARIYTELAGRLTDDTPMVTAKRDVRINPFLLMPDAKSIVVCLFSYYCGEREGNISLYARAEDYHRVAERKMTALSEVLTEKGYKAECCCDDDPLCDRYLAYLAGLGFFGRNNFLINPDFGSYTFIGYILTDADIDEDAPMQKTCIGCGECIKICPGGALSEVGFDAAKCASYLTQKKGSLSDAERKIIKKSGSAWGCDLCQKACPHNRGIKGTDITEFSESLINSVESSMAQSNREFRRKYADRAFSWRGFDVIKRNLDILEEE